MKHMFKAYILADFKLPKGEYFSYSKLNQLIQQGRCKVEIIDGPGILITEIQEQN